MEFVIKKEICTSHVFKHEFILIGKKGHKPKPKGWKSFKQQLSNDEEEHNAENQQTTIWEKDTNACPSVQVEELVTLFGG